MSTSIQKYHLKPEEDNSVPFQEVSAHVREPVICDTVFIVCCL